MKDSRETIVEVSLNGSSKPLKLLPGSEYENILLPLDYMPSRDYNPRWGYSKPLSPKLIELFKRDSYSYIEVINGLKKLESNFQKIPVNFSGSSIGWMGGAMNPIDLAPYYYFVFNRRPKTIVEIGSGISTHFAKRAIDDGQTQSKLLSIDPQPRAEIDRLCDQVIRDGLETLSSFELFENLEAGDIVFLDGSHRSFMNSDVTVFFMDIVPNLKSGVIIHVHDIFLPYDYPELFKSWYWNEQYLLGTYLLAAANQIKILYPGTFVYKDAQLGESLKAQTVNVDGVLPGNFQNSGSFWFTKT